MVSRKKNGRIPHEELPVNEKGVKTLEKRPNKSIFVENNEDFGIALVADHDEVFGKEE